MTTVQEKTTVERNFETTANAASRQITDLKKVVTTENEEELQKKLRNELTAVRKAFRKATTDAGKTKQVVRAHEIGSRAKVLAIELRDKYGEGNIVLSVSNHSEPSAPAWALPALVAGVVASASAVSIQLYMMFRANLPAWQFWCWTVALWIGVVAIILVVMAIAHAWRQRTLADASTKMPKKGRKEES